MPENKTVGALVSEIEQRLATLGRSCEGLSWREKVLLFMDFIEPVKRLGVNLSPDADAANVSARERIRLYLTEYAGKVIEAAELETVLLC